MGGVGCAVWENPTPHHTKKENFEKEHELDF
jgi:hypothetical protein